VRKSYLSCPKSLTGSSIEYGSSCFPLLHAFFCNQTFYSGCLATEMVAELELSWYEKACPGGVMVAECSD
jgi:hypothetical protein